MANKPVTATEIKMREAHVQKDLALYFDIARKALEDLRYPVMMRLYWRLWLLAQHSQLRLTYTPRDEHAPLP